MNGKTFAEFLTENIKDRGINWRYASLKLKVPYMTLYQWHKGLYEPPEYVRSLIIKEIETW